MEAQQTALIVPQDTLDAQRMNREHWEIEGMQRSAKDKAAVRAVAEGLGV